MRASILLTAAIAYLSAGAWADMTGPTTGIEPKTFDEYDGNGDGVLEESEIMEANEGYAFPGETEFHHVDKNDDDQITREEWLEHFEE